MSSRQPRRRCDSSGGQLLFFPRQRRPRSDARKYSLSAFKATTPAPSPPRKEQSAWAAWAQLFPAWMRHIVSWILAQFWREEVEDEALMSGASSGWGSSYTHSSGWQSSATYSSDWQSSYSRYEDEEESEDLWEDRPAWDSIEGRMVEMGLS